MTLTVSHSYKHWSSSLHKSLAVTLPAFHFDGLWSTPVAACMNRGVATAVPTACSKHASILHHISAFVCCVHVFLMSVAVDSVYKQLGRVTVPLFRLTYSYTVSTLYKYTLYHSKYIYLCTLNINILSLNINIKYCCHQVRSLQPVLLFLRDVACWVLLEVLHSKLNVSNYCIGRQL